MDKTIVLYPDSSVSVAYVVLQREFKKESDLLNMQHAIEGAYTKYISEKKRFALVFNAEFINYVGPTYLKKFALWMADKKDINTQYLVGSFIIIKTPFARACIKTILSFFHPARPYYVCDSAESVNTKINNMPELRQSQIRYPTQ